MNIKIFIIDHDGKKIEHIERYFEKCSNVECVCASLHDFLNSNDVECVVSPGNAFGLMDGGYDEAITEFFGEQLPKRVQQYIIDHYCGEQPVGTSFLLDSGIPGYSIIHTPSVRSPQPIKDPLVIYQCMRTALMCAIENNVKSILLPLFGGGCGGISPQVIGDMMSRAYKQLIDVPKKLNWRYVEKHEIIT